MNTTDAITFILVVIETIIYLLIDAPMEKTLAENDFARKMATIAILASATTFVTMALTGRLA